MCSVAFGSDFNALRGCTLPCTGLGCNFLSVNGRIHESELVKLCADLPREMPSAGPAARRVPPELDSARCTGETEDAVHTALFPAHRAERSAAGRTNVASAQ